MNHSRYLGLALPLILTTITTPLLGAVDTAVVGQLDDSSYIAGVAVGTIIFNTMYWLFGFLRVSTSGFAAQAHGTKNEEDILRSLSRPLLLALSISACLVALQYPIKEQFLPLLTSDQAVKSLAIEYFAIRIWGVPFGLLNYVIIGWMMGLAMIKKTLFLQMYMNVTNIVLDILFVKVFSWGVAGVAAATLISEVSTFVIGLFIVWKVIPANQRKKIFQIKSIDLSSYQKMMRMNRDLFIRTLCLLIVFNVFTAKGGTFGTEILAANAILIQIHYIMAYMYDGFANASSILTGRAIGSNDKALYRSTIKLSFQWAIISSLSISSVYFVFKDRIHLLFTSLPEVLNVVGTYEAWIIIFPIVSSFGVVLHGIFVGATEASSLRNSMILALIVFLISLYLATPGLGNHGLWLAFILFSTARSLFLILHVPKLSRTLGFHEVRYEGENKVFNK
ncbi:MATE family efflux transporter [Fictibacillus phosphorivorans]|uniref:MATE family efflux transporter n=1 Tax=Fictibacillus phosphorivorans TaxID=1221500 RepID=UPI001293DC93|nr:MATE family efflux transporter [Fictibacillus phosphorivorans]MQR94295.1 MATE family efflux transporter [Fictibacillus phosphorivorans]